MNQAIIALAESAVLPVTLLFTTSKAPLFIQTTSSTNSFEIFCAISTQECPEADEDGLAAPDKRGGVLRPKPVASQPVPRGIKREREDGPQRPEENVDEQTTQPQAGKKRKKANATQPLPLLRGQNALDAPSFLGISTSTALNAERFKRETYDGEKEESEEPLFFPATQMTQKDVEVFKAAGFGNVEELEALLEDDLEIDEEEGVQSGKTADVKVKEEEFDEYDDWGMDVDFGAVDAAIAASQHATTMLGATQAPLASSNGDKSFRPIFDD